MTTGIFAFWIVFTIVGTLALEAAIQDRVARRDKTWFAWIQRHVNSMEYRHQNKKTEPTNLIENN